MGLWARLKSVFGAKMSSALDRMENPGETLDYSYEKQLGLLTDVRRGLAEVATSKQRLKMQAEKLRQQDTKLGQQAEQAVLAGRDDLARVALERKSVLQPQIQSLGQQVVQLDEQQVKLQDASQKLQTRIEMFRTQKESIKAQYEASSAQVKINESFTGISKEMNDLGTSLQRAQDRIEQMQARSSALDELIDSGALTDYTAQLGGGDDIDRQLSLSAGNDVDRQLAAMKLQLSDNGQSQLESKE
ncbi:MAG TPA: phage shock protein A [Chloroflexi bacterium]|nr:phage shock protein A [Chloroflexota bacterium]